MGRPDVTPTLPDCFNIMFHLFHQRLHRVEGDLVPDQAIELDLDPPAVVIQWTVMIQEMYFAESINGLERRFFADADCSEPMFPTRQDRPSRIHAIPRKNHVAMVQVRSRHRQGSASLLSLDDPALQ